MDIKTEIRRFLAKPFRNYDLKDDEDIFALGVVNSLFAVQLVMFLEQTFRITLNDEDQNIDNFRTINAMVDLIGRKTPAA